MDLSIFLPQPTSSKKKKYITPQNVNQIIFKSTLLYKTSSFGFCFSMCVEMLKEWWKGMRVWFSLLWWVAQIDRLACTQKHNTTSVNNGFPNTFNLSLYFMWKLYYRPPAPLNQCRSRQKQQEIYKNKENQFCNLIINLFGLRHRII